MRVLVAPDKFKGTLTAGEASEAIARGWRLGDSEADVTPVPLADGGEGTLDVLVGAGGGEMRSARVTGPLGEPVDAAFGLLPGSPPTGIVELARASGLALVPPDRRDPTRTTTRGTGELVLAAVRAGARRVLVAVGGSATNDGGAGLAQALGVRLLDAGGRELEPGGAAVLGLERIDTSRLIGELEGVRIEVLTDVDNPLTGPDGASAVFGPQKGASARDVALLDRALGHFADVVLRETGVDVAMLPGAGAAGGAGASMVPVLGATFRSGLEVVMEAAGLRSKLAGVQAVVTGEGAFDAGSLRGKVVGGVLGEARAAGANRLVVLCGVAEAPAPPGVEVRSLVDRFGVERAMDEPARALEELAAEAAATGRVSA